MRLLLIEDEIALQQQLKQQLEKAGYSVDCANDGEDGLFQATEIAYDLAIIDLGLPKIDGLTVIEKIRAKNITTPIIILTARSQWQEKVKGLEVGADDYVTKPFQMDEVLARVKALLRRSAGLASAEICFGYVSLNLNTSTVYLHQQNEITPVDLTAFEYKVLEYLFVHPHEIISKMELTEHIYDQDFDRDSNVIEVFVGRLRKKLALDQQPTLIETLRGRGYRINPALIH
jgi:two-component system response regulator PhoP